jgi:hypothetical protein
MESNSFNMNFEHRDGYLYAYAHAEKDSFKTSFDFWLEIARRCKVGGFTKVLVEEDFDNDLSMIDMYELTSQGHKIGLTGIKIAFVDCHISQIDNNLFGETVARNRGILGKVFTDIKKAEAWLLS